MEQTSNKNKLYLGLGFLGLVFIIGAGIMFYRAYRATVSRNNTQESQETLGTAEERITSEESSMITCNLAVDYGEGTPSAYSVARAENTALDCLIRASAENGFEVEVEQSSFGALVKSINKVANSSEQFWMFYINDSLGQVASDQAQIDQDDLVEWRFEKIE